MFPWIRLLRAGCTAIGASRAELLATTRVRMHVWLNDLDLNLHVNNGRYLQLADIARLHWFVRTGAMRVAMRQRAVPIVGDAIAKFRRDLKLLQKFEIQTRLLGWDHRWGFLEHRFVREQRVLGVVAVRGVFKGPNGPIPPEVLLGEIGLAVSSPDLPEWVTQWNGGCETLSALLRHEEGERRRSHPPVV